jgi:hypothetical protein
MALKIEKGARFRLRGSESTIEVVEYEPDLLVRYHVVEPEPNPALAMMFEREFRNYVIDPETDLTEREASDAQERAFKREMLRVDYDYEHGKEELEDKRRAATLEISQRTLDRRGEITEGEAEKKRRGTGVREAMAEA